MECGDLREKLSAYLDGDVSVEERAAMDAHLEICQDCRDAFADLEKTVGYLRGMEDVEPPAWLAQKVMTTVRKEAESRQRWRRKLLYPLYLKVPAQAAALVLIVVVGLYVFRATEPEMKVAMAPRENAAPAVPQKTEGLREEEKAEITAGGARRYVGIQTEKEIPAPAGTPESSADAAERQKMIVPRRGHRGDERREKLAEAQRTAVATNEMEHGTVLLEVRDRAAALDNAVTIIRELGGEVVTAERLDSNPTLTIHFHADSVNELIETLSALGTVTYTPLPTAIAEKRITLLLEIHPVSGNP
jgi:anti-sigma factor ChrR (cupin superfamily)